MKISIQSTKPDFNFQLSCKNQGIVGIYGVSGSGKSSLLDAIAGYNDRATGEITFRKTKLLDANKPKISVLKKCNYMRQNPILFPHWTVKENLQFAANYSQNTTNWQGLLEALHCQHLLEKYPNELSGGEKQRVAFIRTLLQIEDDGLVLLDEPFNALDHVTRKRALRLLETHKKNALIFMVTHDVHEIYQYADDMILIDQGRIIYHGHVTQAMSADKFHLPVASRLKIKQTIMIIYADDVSITLQQNPNSSIMHQMMANITEISITDCSVLMALSITSLKNTGNNTLLAKITKQSLHNLQLRKGQQVYACFKASSYQTDK